MMLERIFLLLKRGRKDCNVSWPCGVQIFSKNRKYFFLLHNGILRPRTIVFPHIYRCHIRGRDHTVKKRAYPTGVPGPYPVAQPTAQVIPVEVPLQYVFPFSSWGVEKSKKKKKINDVHVT